VATRAIGKSRAARLLGIKEQNRTELASAVLLVNPLSDNVVLLAR
jgi:hypothetical protein